MKIRELYLKNFGKFSDEKIIFKDGINLFYGENESGKTTIHTFIKSMFFGLERGKGRASLHDEFSRYEPWENPNYYSGILKFESGGKNFILTRNFDKYGKSASLVCEDDGEEFSLEHGDLEMLLNGLNSLNYENTVAVGQMKIETNQNLAIELQNYATNYYATGNSDIDLEGALSKLRDQKKESERRIRDLQQKKQAKRREIEQEKSFVWREAEKMRQELEVLEKNIEIAKKDEKSIQDKAPKWTDYWVAWLVLILLCAVFSFVSHISLVALAVVVGAYVWRQIAERRKWHAMEQSIQAEGKYPKLRWQREHLQSELKEKQIIYNNLQEQLDELEEQEGEYKKQEETSRALDLAMDKILELSKGVHEELGIRLNQKASEILSEITNGKYEMLFIDEKLKMSLYTEGRRISIEQVSRGTIEQIYFALRMAASEILHEEEYPVILDDTFVYYDEKRLENTLKWLKKNKKQVILFTCQKREEEILNKIEN